MLCGLVVCGETILTSGSSSSFGLFSCWNTGMCGSVTWCSLPGQRQASFHFTCRSYCYLEWSLSVWRPKITLVLCDKSFRKQIMFLCRSCYVNPKSFSIFQVQKWLKTNGFDHSMSQRKQWLGAELSCCLESGCCGQGGKCTAGCSWVSTCSQPLVLQFWCFAGPAEVGF